MALYELEKATIGDIEGQGYAFTRKTVFGKVYQGVFFPDDDTAMEELQEEDELTFSGLVYHRRRNRSARKKEESFPVSIIDSTTTPLGERAEFKAADSP